MVRFMASTASVKAVETTKVAIILSWAKLNKRGERKKSWTKSYFLNSKSSICIHETNYETSKAGVTCDATTSFSRWTDSIIRLAGFALAKNIQILAYEKAFNANPPYSSFKSNWGWTDEHGLLQRCVVASKNDNRHKQNETNKRKQKQKITS